jgi:hypothetical protein
VDEVAACVGFDTGVVCVAAGDSGTGAGVVYPTGWALTAGSVARWRTLF